MTPINYSYTAGIEFTGVVKFSRIPPDLQFDRLDQEEVSASDSRPPLLPSTKIRRERSPVDSDTSTRGIDGEI